MKKAQTTTFIIIGILIVAAIGFLLFLRGNLTFIQREVSLEEELAAINRHVSTCLHDISSQEATLLGKQGGYLKQLEGSYRLYNDTQIAYLCYNMDEIENCRNRLLLKVDMERNLENNVHSLLFACINLDVFKSQRYAIVHDNNWKVNTIIGDESILVSLDFPIKLVSQTTRAELSNIEYNIILNHPLGSLYKVTQDIIKDEATFGNFDPLPYMLDNPQYKIIKLRPYPDKVYILKKVGSQFSFQMAIQGE